MLLKEISTLFTQMNELDTPQQVKQSNVMQDEQSTELDHFTLMIH